MTFLICTQCGRFSEMPPEAPATLAKWFSDSGIKMLCPCGRCDSWLWQEHAMREPMASDLPELRRQHQILRAAAFAAAVLPDTSPADLSGPSPVLPRN
jgi:hypothetical protein